MQRLAARRAGGSSRPARRRAGAASGRASVCRTASLCLVAGTRRGPRSRPRSGRRASRSAWSAWQASTTSSKRSGAPPRGGHLDVVGVSACTATTGVFSADAVGERRRERVDVARRAADDRLPLRPVAEAEHPVVREELGEEAHREVPHLRRVGGPHGAGLRDDQAVDEPLASSRRRRGTRRATGPGSSPLAAARASRG